MRVTQLINRVPRSTVAVSAARGQRLIYTDLRLLTPAIRLTVGRVAICIRSDERWRCSMQLNR